MRPLAVITTLIATALLNGCASTQQSAEATGVHSKSQETDNGRRLITLRADDFERLHPLLPRREDLELIGDADELGETIQVLTYEVQVSWLRALGAEVLDEDSAIPRTVIDADHRARHGRPPPRDAQGRLVTNDGYKDAAMVEALMRAFAEDYPEITRLHVIGHSLEGRPLLALLITDNPGAEEGEPAFLFNGMHHGSELLSPEPVLDLIEQVTHGHADDPAVRAWVDAFEIWCVPVVNPDGLDRHWYLSSGTGRRNARDLNDDGTAEANEGVDLNRNYPFLWGRGGKRASSDRANSSYQRGAVPGSEPETQAVMRLADAQRFVASVSYHTAATSLLVPYTIDGALTPNPSFAWAFARDVEPLIESHRSSRPYRARRHLYPVDGTDQDWHMAAHGTEAYLLELPRHNPDYAQHRDPIVEGARPLWRSLFERFLTGPTLTGRVVDAATGQPLEAVISIDEIRWGHREIHTSHPETGRFDRLLPAPGIYHVRAERHGWEPRVVEVEVGEEWRTVEIALSRPL